VAHFAEPSAHPGRKLSCGDFFYVQDVDQSVERAVARGARVLIPAQNQFWGDRIAWIMDPSGHVWTIATRVEEPSEEERQDRWSSILSNQTKP
jgi:PhnB protein